MIFVGTTNVPYRIIIEFCDLLTTLDSRYTVPGRTRIAKEAQKFLIELKAKISSFWRRPIKSASVPMCGPKMRLTTSYLGITAHFSQEKSTVLPLLTLQGKAICQTPFFPSGRRPCSGFLGLCQLCLILYYTRIHC